MKDRNLPHSDNWATPARFYYELNKEFDFNFDPCPYEYNPETHQDGLKIEWKERNFINPPYSRKLKEAFIMKAIEESKKGKLCVMLLPVSTSTNIFQQHIQINAKLIRFVEGRIPFVGINTKGQAVNYNQNGWKVPEGMESVKNSGMHDSMIVIFETRQGLKEVSQDRINILGKIKDKL